MRFFRVVHRVVHRVVRLVHKVVRLVSVVFFCVSFFFFVFFKKTVDTRNTIGYVPPRKPDGAIPLPVKTANKENDYDDQHERNPQR